MAIPKYNEMYKSFLKTLIDGEEHTLKDVKEQVIQDFNLSEDEINELVSSGTMTVLYSRISWCRTYLKNARLIESPARARFIITQEGKRLYENEDVITDDTLRNYPSFLDFLNNRSSSNNDVIQEVESRDETPLETLDRVCEEMDKVLIDEILAKLCVCSPTFFENMVVKLLEKMGYGRGVVTRRSRDGGIDGLVYQDKLGFDVIYIQAKRYNVDSSISRPMLQAFVGATTGCNKRLYITTAKYSQDAIRFAKEEHLILIDGQKLARLMIEYDFGVSIEYVYKVKKIDNDMFEEE